MQNVTFDRDKYIGGSDVPIIMGLSHFKSRLDLLLEKTGLKEIDFDGNEYTEYGNVMECKIREYINERLNRKFQEGKYIIDDIRCHTDGIDSTTVLEIKTTSQIKKSLKGYKAYLVQLLFYMYHTGKNSGMLAVYERPWHFDDRFDCNRLQLFEINIKDYAELVIEIDNAVNLFRDDLNKIRADLSIGEKILEETLQKEQDELLRKKALMKISYLLSTASNELRDYKKFVLYAVRRDWSEIRFASERLKNDKEVAIAAIKKNYAAIEYISQDLLNDKDVIMTAVKKCGRAFSYASVELKKDKEIVLETIKKDPYQIRNIPEEFKNDKDVVKCAIMRNKRMLRYASKELQNDAELIYIANNN